MGTLILLNDVSTEDEEVDLLVGNADPPASEKGNSQADVISSRVLKECPTIDLVFSSDAQRIKKLVHKIRIGSKDRSLTQLTPRRMEALQERSFGILNRTQISLLGDLFTHTRIKAEKGESVYECRVRITNYILSVVERHSDKVILMASHPLACQIAFNAILQKDHTYVTEFWIQKGSFVVFSFRIGRYGIEWKFENAHNSFSDISYTPDQIYRGLLRKERTSPG